MLVQQVQFQIETMFANLSDRLGGVLKKVRGQGRITEDNIQDTLREVRMALLEADVALPVVQGLHRTVRVKAAGPGSAAQPDAGTGADQDRPRRAGPR